VARELARDSGGEVHVLHVVPNIWHQPLNVEEPFIDNATMERQWIEAAQQQLTSLLADEGVLDQAVPVAMVGVPGTTIVQYADEQAADLIVMGAQGHGHVHRFLLGSVAERVTRAASCPVMIVPHHMLRGTKTMAASGVASAAQS
jgi:universal stress protein A